jgi:inorganic triphosphatase YgiF
MTTEVEARFGASGPEPLRRLAARASLGAGALGPPRGFEEEDVYLDTASGALAAARWACRLRTRDGRTVVSLKGPPEPEGGEWLHRRPEAEGPATPDRDPGAWPPSSAKERLTALTGGAPLVERFVLHQHRVERTVTIDAKRVGTLTLDTVDVEREGANRGRFHVVELELTTGTEDESVLRPLAAALDATPGLTPEPRTKLERALETMPGR